MDYLLYNDLNYSNMFLQVMSFPDKGKDKDQEGGQKPPGQSGGPQGQQEGGPGKSGGGKGGKGPQGPPKKFANLF